MPEHNRNNREGNFNRRGKSGNGNPSRNPYKSKFNKRDQEDAGSGAYGKRTPSSDFGKRTSSGDFPKGRPRISKKSDYIASSNRGDGATDKPYPASDFSNRKRREPNFRTNDQRPRRKRIQSGHAGNTPSDFVRPRVEKDELVRLNRYIANSGICSRRKADELIEAGVIQVNGEVVSTVGTKINPVKDEVRYNGERLKRERMVYVLLNKPKDYITTTDDPQERKTVMHLVEKASRERIYPVGRLDRNTTGLLLMTNDGDLAEKLSHPRNNVTKIYQVELDKNLTQGDFNKIEFGLELEDGFIKPDAISYVQGGSKKDIGIQIHSGKNHIVRRIFESLGYNVIKLDRSIYANLTKKDLGRGRWRYLEEKEVIQLKHIMKVNH